MPNLTKFRQQNLEKKIDVLQMCGKKRRESRHERMKRYSTLLNGISLLKWIVARLFRFNPPSTIANARKCNIRNNWNNSNFIIRQLEKSLKYLSFYYDILQFKLNEETTTLGIIFTLFYFTDTFGQSVNSRTNQFIYKLRFHSKFQRLEDNRCNICSKPITEITYYAPIFVTLCRENF